MPPAVGPLPHLTLIGVRHWIPHVPMFAIVAVILWSTWGLLRDSILLALDAVPAHIELSKVKACLESLPGVTRAHHVHVWAMSTNEVALTAHLVMPGGHPGDAFFEEAEHILHGRFGIDHPTLQIETAETADPAHRDGGH